MPIKRSMEVHRNWNGVGGGGGGRNKDSVT